ncbi:hypothetical protein V6N11_058324 [Hibiscus sabdariffa]|uniref:Uncharacterized protein n=1 Tax=Hibiscus sabdariffa TaxID=183260 RepID=A0ABR2U486_9ROSI
MRWMLPWTFLTSVCPDASIGCFTPSASPWWCPHGCAFVPWPRYPFRRLAARSVRALPWPVRPLVAWRASHHWVGLFGPLSCAASLCFLVFVSFLSQVTVFALFYLIYLFAAGFLAAYYSHPLLLLHATHG